MLRGKWRALRSGGNSARLGNLIDLWFVAGSLDATNQTAGRSPFIATSSLAELYRRSVTPLYLPCISLHLPYISPSSTAAR